MPPFPIPFTARESQVFRLMREGLSNTELVQRTGWKTAVVTNTLQALFKKLQIKGRGKLVVVAVRAFGLGPEEKAGDRRKEEEAKP